ncbi:MAG: tRNA (guanine(46)-N(7))-methyltransferase TrmB [Alcanivorax sediminis]|uniref:tRNA (guanine(46)-N(7))-methyltransferase n=1 Tax=Alcanivorax sediminis TaxID=2663008 RepID=A0A6N7LXP5_9GAMM|nr:methyltransferase domain-containing protein [Alcanivorax sediminis]MQX53885.1 methyltransferase domain-containing protein [Alcanivorax sediminis]
MFANSREVQSNQDGVHADLEKVVRRHLASPWLAPVADFDCEAFDQACRWRQAHGPDLPLMLDSGCGTGRSSVRLAQSHPDALVIGVDQSADRLSKAERRFAPLPDNLLLVRSDCAGLWRLMVEAGWQLARHQILYPNPWPKSAHLKRRWHGHPVWPAVLALGGELELRSNWRVYLEEVRATLALSHCQAVIQPLAGEGVPMTDFEEKYQASGQVNWQLIAKL